MIVTRQDCVIAWAWGLSIWLFIGGCDSIRHDSHKESSVSSKRQANWTAGPPPVFQGRRMEDTIFGTPGHNETTIVGGSPVLPAEFPWYVKFDGLVLCGGSLIHPRFVLTAAHCVDVLAPLTVSVGSAAQVLVRGLVVESIIHPDYDADRSLYHDIALLRLANPILLPTVELNKDPNYPIRDGATLSVIGQGQTAFGFPSPILLQTEVKYQNPYDCGYNSRYTLCANQRDVGPCFGDSGGPLVDRHKVQVGIVSFGIGECASSSPDYYVRISTYHEWIQEKIDQNPGLVDWFFGLVGSVVTFLLGFILP